MQWQVIWKPLVQLSVEVFKFPLVDHICADLADNFHHRLHDVVQFNILIQVAPVYDDAVESLKLRKCLNNFAKPHKSVYKSDHG